MNGILCVDKPAGFTSFDVVAKMRGIAGTRRIGHAGTLDPEATGVLPLFLGRATKCCDLLPNHDKRYTAEIVLGVETDTQDMTGQVTGGQRADISEEMLRGILPQFLGHLMQLPPMYSAVKVDGKRLYQLARQGREVERQPRPVTIYRLELLGLDSAAQRGSMDVHCSKGTYVRTLCHDIGKALGCGAAMGALRRTMAAGFTLADCITIEEAQTLADDGALAGRVLPMDTLFSAYPAVTLDEAGAARFLNGAVSRLAVAESLPETPVRVYGPAAFLGLGRRLPEGELVVEKNLYAGQGDDR